nr:MAG TPA: hypothetical protein [Caudoviricetes sp.]
MKKRWKSTSPERRKKLPSLYWNYKDGRRGRLFVWMEHISLKLFNQPHVIFFKHAGAHRKSARRNEGR